MIDPYKYLNDQGVSIVYFGSMVFDLFQFRPIFHWCNRSFSYMLLK